VRSKLNFLTIGFRVGPEDMTPTAKDFIGKITDYAEKRAVKTAFMTMPMLGVWMRHSKLCLREDALTLDLGCAYKGRREKHYCWSRDDLIAEKGRAIGKYLRDTGCKYVILHSLDTGGALNPENWSARCDQCRKRFGDDYAKATVNFFSIIHREIMRERPTATLILIQCPYHATMATQRGAEHFIGSRFGPVDLEKNARKHRQMTMKSWKALAEGMPPEVMFCAREDFRKEIESFAKIIRPHPLYTYYQVYTLYWDALFTTFPRHCKTQLTSENDLIHLAGYQNRMLQECFSQYAWDTEYTGAEYWTPDSAESYGVGEEQGLADFRGPAKVINDIMPRLAEYIFGPEAADDMAIAFSQGICPRYIKGGRPSRFITTVKDRDTEEMFRQWQGAEKAADALDRVWNRFEDERPWNFGGKIFGTDRRLSWDGCLIMMKDYLMVRVSMHCHKYMAGMWYNYWKGMELMREGKTGEGEELVDLALKLHDDMNRKLPPICKESGTQPVMGANRKDLIWFARNYHFKYADKLKQEIEEFKTKGLAAADAGIEIPESIIKQIQTRKLYSTQTSGALKIDGRLDEPDWQRACPAQNFVVYRSDPTKLSRKDTRVRSLFDGGNVYFAFECFDTRPPIGIEKLRKDRENWPGKDSIEIFLNPSADRKNYYQIALGPNNELFDDRAGPEWTRDPDWDSGVQHAVSSAEDRWIMEVKIPLERFEGAKIKPGDKWRAFYARQIADEKGESVENTSVINIMHSRGFRAVWLHPELEFVKPAATPAPGYNVEIAIPEIEAKTEALPDRRATVVKVKPEIKTDTMLHDVSLEIVPYDEKGNQLMGRVKITPEIVPPVWKSPDDLVIGLDVEREKFELKARLTSEEGTFTKTFTQ